MISSYPANFSTGQPMATGYPEVENLQLWGVRGANPPTPNYFYFVNFPCSLTDFTFSDFPNSYILYLRNFPKFPTTSKIFREGVSPNPPFFSTPADIRPELRPDKVSGSSLLKTLIFYSIVRNNRKDLIVPEEEVGASFDAEMLSSSLWKETVMQARITVAQ